MKNNLCERYNQRSRQLALKGNRYNLGKLLGLIIVSLSAVATASAQSLTWVGDFSNMTAGTVRPIYAVGTGSWNFPDSIAVADFAIGNGGGGWEASDGLGFSFNSSGPFTPQLNVPLPLDYWGNGTTQTIYMKALTQTAAVQVGGCGSTVSCGVTSFFSISGTQPPAPTPNPTPTVRAIALGDVVAYWLVTASPTAPEYRDSTVRFTITPNIYLGAANSSTSSTWGAAIAVDMPIDAAGNGRSSTFYLKGRSNTSGTTSIAATSDNRFAVAHQTISMSVSNITFFEWVPYSGAYPLDVNPGSGGGGRIFADKNSPYESDAAPQPWRMVGLKVRISPAVAGMNVRLKIFDVDDPSDDYAVDPNGSSGNDNRAGTTGLTANLITNASGEAFLYYAVSSQPGDNYRAAAVLSSLPITSGTVARQQLDSVTVNGIDFSSGSGSVPAASPSNGSPETLVKSSLLTVWRRLHIERDSMGLVTNNHASGSFYRVQDYGLDPEFPDSWAFDLDAASTPLPPGRFAGGRLVFQETPTSTPRIFTVISNSSTQVRVNKGKGSPFDINFSQDTFKLYDDDDFNRSNPFGSGWDANEAGDEGEQIPQPDVSLMQDSDNVTLNLFARAYIRPKYDLAGENGHLPFVLNTTGDTSRFDNIAHIDNPDFWTMYLLNAYQPLEDEDGDPDSGEVGTVADLIQGISAWVFFVETHTDLENQFIAAGNTIPAYLTKPGTVAHYTAVLLGAEGGDGGIMGDSNGNCSGGCFSFSGVSLNKIRSALHP